MKLATPPQLKHCDYLPEDRRQRVAGDHDTLRAPRGRLGMRGVKGTTRGLAASTSSRDTSSRGPCRREGKSAEEFIQRSGRAAPRSSVAGIEVTSIEGDSAAIRSARSSTENIELDQVYDSCRGLVRKGRLLAAWACSTKREALTGRIKDCNAMPRHGYRPKQVGDKRDGQPSRYRSAEDMHRWPEE